MTSENTISPDAKAHVIPDHTMSSPHERPPAKNAQYGSILNADPADVIGASRFSRISIPQNISAPS